MRLHVAIAHAGIASRRKAEILIQEGKVCVNGRVVTEQGFLVDPQKDQITVSGVLIPRPEKKVYYIVNKPKGYISTTADTHERKTVLDLIPKTKGIYPAGRLDKNSRGLLLLTNDGELCFRLTHPKFGVKKTYRVLIDGEIEKEALEKFKKGIMLYGRRTSPMELEVLHEDRQHTLLEIRMHEGRKRQIREMFLRLGYKVCDLNRIQYANLNLDIKEGQCRLLKEDELRGLKKLAGFQTNAVR